MNAALRFLPAIFRPRTPRPLPNQENGIVPNLAANDTPDQPPQPPPAPPVTNIAAPVSPSTGQVMDENAVRPRRVNTDKKGRPIPQVNAIDPQQKAADYDARLQSYEPQKATGFWD